MSVSLRRAWLPWMLASLLILVATPFALASLVHAADGDTTVRFDPYLHRTTGELADPVNLIFRGGDANLAADAVTRVLGWPLTRGSEMTFDDRGATRPTAVQFGHDLGAGSRLHIRIEAVEKVDGQTYVLAGVHRDDTMPCGHVGLAFNKARDLVAHSFAALGYSVSSEQLQNSLPGHQCDGRLTSGDGKAAVIDLGSRRMPAAAPIIPAGGLLAPAYLDFH